jgi:hypothetical protein
MKSKILTVGSVRDISANAKDTRTISFILSNSDRDRHHTVLNQNNWSLDNYKRNPVIGYMHNLYGNSFTSSNPDDVIGQTKRIGIETISGRTILTCDAYFETADINPLADKIFRKLMLGSLRAVSVGFLEIGAGSWGKGDEAQGGKNETYRFAGQELLEWSVVNIPSNAGSGKRGMESMRAQTHSALMYAFQELGMNYRISQIENMRICDVLTLFEGKDLEIREKNPEKVRKMLSEEEIRKAYKKIQEKDNELATYEMLKKYSLRNKVNKISEELGLKQLPEDWRFI